MELDRLERGQAHVRMEARAGAAPSPKVLDNWDHTHPTSGIYTQNPSPYTAGRVERAEREREGERKLHRERQGVDDLQEEEHRYREFAAAEERVRQKRDAMLGRDTTAPAPMSGENEDVSGITFPPKASVAGTSTPATGMTRSARITFWGVV